MYPYRSLYPLATKRQWRLKNGEERYICTVVLKDPDKNVSGCWSHEEPKSDDSSGKLLRFLYALRQLNYLNTNCNNKRNFRSMKISI